MTFVDKVQRVPELLENYEKKGIWIIKYLNYIRKIMWKTRQQNNFRYLKKNV